MTDDRYLSYPSTVVRDQSSDLWPLISARAARAAVRCSGRMCPATILMAVSKTAATEVISRLTHLIPTPQKTVIRQPKAPIRAVNPLLCAGMHFFRRVWHRIRSPLRTALDQAMELKVARLPIPAAIIR